MPMLATTLKQNVSDVTQGLLMLLRLSSYTQKRILNCKRRVELSLHVSFFIVQGKVNGSLVTVDWAESTNNTNGNVT